MKHSKGLIAFIIAGALLLILIFSVVGSYNNLVNLNETINTKKSDIDTYIQRRANLIPNLVSSVKGYMQHEQAAIDAVTDARAKLSGASTDADKAAADDALTSSVKNLIVLVENYPNLKADQTVKDLIVNLEGSENRIATARKDYNDAVKVYNAKIRTFPTNIIAGLFNFDKAAYFQATSDAQSVPNVDLTSQGTSK